MKNHEKFTLITSQAKFPNKCRETGYHDQPVSQVIDKRASVRHTCQRQRRKAKASPKGCLVSGCRSVRSGRVWWGEALGKTVSPRAPFRFLNTRIVRRHLWRLPTSCHLHLHNGCTRLRERDCQAETTVSLSPVT